MARRAHGYPQVEPRASALANARLAAVDARVSVAAALQVARKRDVHAVAMAPDVVVLREDLARASTLGLDQLAASVLARPLPVVEASGSEVAVRRHLAAGAPLVVVRDAGRPAGAVVPRSVAQGAVVSMAARFSRGVSPETARLLTTAGTLAAALGARAWVVGGLVRDLWGEARVERRDLDIVIEGDGSAVARLLADAMGGGLLLHERFLTASVDTPEHGRIDVITARSERYEIPGALPRVMPAGIAQDLKRRDFTINAMAVDLSSPGLALLDPLGGRVDFSRRRLSLLHPLSFVEDPTRIFRGARYAARLGFALDAWTARCQALALRLVPYPALSGRRLVAELERIVTAAAPEVALRRLGATGVFRLFDPRYRFSAATAARLAALPAAFAWAEARRLPVVRADLALLAVLGDQVPDVAASALTRLGFSGEPLARLARALDAGPTLPARLAAAETSSARARLLRDRGPAELAWLWLAGDAAVRSTLDWFGGSGPRWDVLLRGDDLIALGVPRGPEVARVREALRDARVDGTIADRAGETAYVREWLRAGREG